MPLFMAHRSKHWLPHALDIAFLLEFLTSNVSNFGVFMWM